MNKLVDNIDILIVIAFLAINLIVEFTLWQKYKNNKRIRFR